MSAGAAGALPPEPVAWDLAERVALRVGGGDAFARSYHSDSLGPDFEELTTEAEGLVAETTGLVSLHGPARARVTDRAGWVRANIASFRRLLRPVTTKLGERISANPVAGAVTRTVTGIEVGTLLGWMSTRVLGQYDLLVVDDDTAADQDIVYYVGPNILSLEKRFAFPPREFRLWLALHEVTHRAQFTGIPWLRPHFLSLVERSLQGVDTDPRRIVGALRRAVEEARAGRNPLDEGGLVALMATPEQQEVLGQIGGMMSLLEGHGDITMDRASAGRIPSAGRFGQVLRQRRAQASRPARLVRKLVGLEAKLNQYEQGERFIEAVEAVGGPELVARAWTAPELLPDLAEIRHPWSWIERVGAGIAVHADGASA
ncbi:MAG: zinc-dependent metalloprotease [Acidimicrobiales bacterium]